MKIDRLIGILSVLLQKESITAPELAEKYEVSRRTINRDVEDLCRAGIPIQTTQGIGGGIRIMDGYRMDRTLLTSKDMQMIMAGLRSLDSISGSHYYAQLMEKLKSGSSELIAGSDSILIDLSSWSKDAIAPKIAMIQDAIEERMLLSFDYYAKEGDSHRLIEPYYLIFKWSSWYVWGFCHMRNDFRLFKLNRMAILEKSEEKFQIREVAVPDLAISHIFPGGIPVTALFSSDSKWRLVEEYGPDCFTERKDGKLLFHGDYTNMESLLSWLLTFLDNVLVIEPREVQEELLTRAKKIVQMYEEEDTK